MQQMRDNSDLAIWLSDTITDRFKNYTTVVTIFRLLHFLTAGDYTEIKKSGKTLIFKMLRLDNFGQSIVYSMKTLLPLVFTFFTAFAFGQVSTPAVQKTPIVSRTIAQPIANNNGSFFKNLKSENVSVSDIQANLNEWLGLSADHTFREIANTTDNLGIKNQNFQQFYKGILINESAVMLHSKDGIATAINGTIIAVEKFETQAGIAPPLAKNNAMQALNATKLINEYPVERVIMKIIVNEKQEIKLAYKVRIDASDPIQMCTVFIDAVSGKVLRKVNLIAHADEPGTGHTLYRGEKAITVDNNQGTYRLRQFGRKIETYDATNATFTDASGFQNFSDFTNPTSNWSTVNPAIDVHWGMEKTYDFYTATFNRNSYDNLGSPIKNFVNGTLQLSNTQNNAYALPPPYNVMVYGLGDGINYNPVVGLDVAGHEFSHMIVQNNGNGGLIYYGESGALNESFADIFGTAVEFYAGENANWTIGEGIVVAAPFYFRSMSDPNAASIPSPDTYQGTYWRDPAASFDAGGVHYNSGVQNFWFYLLSEGGTGTNDVGYSYNVSPIGLAKALQIAYRNLNTYLPLGANYGDAREGALQAAEDLYGAGSPEYASVLEAWNAVNVLGAPVRLCEGTTLLLNAAGTFTDNSGNLNYQNFSDCKWLIAPEGAQQITLNFTAFETEFDYDFVTVYDGPSLTAPVLGVFSGSSLPATLSTSMGVGEMLIRFTSDYTFNGEGWSATYSSLVPGTCVQLPTFVTSTGSFNDGSENDNYGVNQHCTWLIAPPCTETVSLSFSEFDTELDEDKVLVYDDEAATNLIATVSGTNLPGTIVSTTGIMSVHFVTNHQNQFEGFSANYTSTAITPVAYTGNSIQNFCGNATIEDLNQTATTKWFETDTGGTPLTTGTTLIDGGIYFATQNYGCETIPRFPVTAHVIERPVIDSIQPIRKCLRYILPSLSQGKYYTQPGGNGTELFEGDAITTSQTLYVYIAPEPGFDCNAEMEFEVEIYNNCDTPYYGEDFSICEGSNPDPLLDFTPDGVFGEWSPPEINTAATTTYTFSPYDDQFYNPITLTITVTESEAPLFDAIPAICSGANLTALPTVSNNGISGTWSPSLNNLETTTYTFTPNSGQCAVAATMTIVINLDTIPTFDPVAAICEGQTLAALPTTSTNGITGIWSPALNTLQTTTYTFTPDNDQCAVATTMVIAVNENVMPTFNAVTAICSGATLSALPTTSLNGIVGTWSPGLDNLATTTYTFTPNANQCASTTTFTINVNPTITPTFNAVTAICSGATLSALPTTSLNDIVGTWSPSLNNLATTTYTFTPNVGQCSSTTTLTISVNPNVTPTFDAVTPICSGATLSALPTTSLNGIVGTWSPNLNNSVTTIYTFTPNAGQCSEFANLEIVVNSIDATTSFISETITANQANASYQWINCNGNVAIAGADSQNFTATQNGDYAVEISIGDCSVLSDCVTIDTLGVEDLKKEECSIYPNPTASILYLQTSKNIEVDRIVIFDVTGKLVIEKRNAVSEINVEKLESGVYIIHAYSGNTLFQDKFIKK